MQSNPVGWFEIYVQDVSRATKFYEATFTLKLEKQKSQGSDPSSKTMQMMSFPMRPEGRGAAGALVKMEGFPSGANSTIVYFTCEDCATEASRATKNGGKILKDKYAIGSHGHIALVIDTEGNVIGLHSMK
jgi:uncharacterized protein